VVVKSKDGNDIRVYLINCTAIPEGKKARLEFTAPSRKEIIQNIPLINNTDNSWTIKVFFLLLKLIILLLLILSINISKIKIFKFKNFKNKKF